MFVVDNYTQTVMDGDAAARDVAATDFTCQKLILLTSNINIQTDISIPAIS